jgi:four helix bundle protein
MPESFRSRGFRFAVDTLRLYRILLRGHDVPWHIANQMLRAGTSIGANLEEAKSASSRRDLAARNAVALREARECRFWLALIRTDQPHLENTIDPILQECQEIVAILTSAVRKLREPSNDEPRAAPKSRP